MTCILINFRKTHLPSINENQQQPQPRPQLASHQQQQQQQQQTISHTPGFFPVNMNIKIFVIYKIANYYT
jgi:hypothetical protein